MDRSNVENGERKKQTYIIPRGQARKTISGCRRLQNETQNSPRPQPLRGSEKVRYQNITKRIKNICILMNFDKVLINFDKVLKR